MFQMFFFIRFVLLEKGQDIRRHIAQLRRSHSPESHGLGFKKSLQQGWFALRRQAERLGVIV
jgi:hypothetical protein